MTKVDKDVKYLFSRFIRDLRLEIKGLKISMSEKERSKKVKKIVKGLSLGRHIMRFKD